MSATADAASDDSYRRIVARLGIDLDVAVPVRSTGNVAVVPQQWLWVVVDSHLYQSCLDLAETAEELLALRLAAANPGKELPRILEALVDARRHLAVSIAEIASFGPPPADPLGAAIDSQLDLSNRLLSQFRAATVDGNEAAALEPLIRALRKGNSSLLELLTSPPASARQAAELLHEMFALPPGSEILDGSLDPNMLRSRSRLDASQLDELAAQQLEELLPPGVAWIPNPTIFLAAMVLAERPLAARRMAAYSRDAVLACYARNPQLATEALLFQRRNGPAHFTASKAVGRELAAIKAARSSGDREGLALAAARVYAATAEGPVKHSAITLLVLLGIDVPEKPSLAFLRDNLAKHAAEAGALTESIEPEWRNAVDHREYSWDPKSDRLMLRGEQVPIEDPLSRHALGLSAVAGLECGITIAVASVPDLLDRVERIAPIHADRVLVEHRLGQQLAVQGVEDPRVEVTQSGIVVGPLADAAIVEGLAGVVGASDYLGEEDVIELRFQTLPPLLVTPDARMRARRLQKKDAENHSVLETDAAVPLLVSGLVELGTAPEDAVDRCTQAALNSFVDGVSPNTEQSVKALARRVQRSALRARQAIREAQIVGGVRSDASQEASKRLRLLEKGAARYLGGGGRDPEPMLAALRSVQEVAEQLPGGALPWFPTEGTEAIQSPAP